MADLLVKLYDLHPQDTIQDIPPGSTIAVRRAMACEKHLVVQWVMGRFGDGWSGECDVAFARQPVACLLAVAGQRLAGFACYDSTCLNFFGPIGVDPVFRHQGVGRRLLLATLEAMAAVGYAYAIIGGAGPTAFFEKCVTVYPILGSTPGIYPPAILRT